MSSSGSGPEAPLPALDRRQLLDASGGSPEIAEELVGILEGEVGRLWARIEAAGARGDLAEVADAAHSIKGSARTLGFVRLAAAAEVLERAAESGGDIAGPRLGVEAVLGDPASHRQA